MSDQNIKNSNAQDAFVVAVHYIDAKPIVNFYMRADDGFIKSSQSISIHQLKSVVDGILQQTLFNDPSIKANINSVDLLDMLSAIGHLEDSAKIKIY
jgi:hypothetical protein